METRVARDLLQRIQNLESAHVSLKEEISKLLLAETLASENAAKRRHHESYSASWKRISPKFQNSSSPVKLDSGGGGDFQLKSVVYLNILQSMGQAIHIMNTDNRIIYWNRPAQNLYGYSAAEALGKTVFELLVDSEHFDLGLKIVNRVKIGECWTGLFPVRSKMGRRFSIIVTDTPLYDEDGTVIGVICIATDSKPFEDMRFTLPDAKTNISTEFDLDPEQQPLQDAVASKITDLATKAGNIIRSKLKGNATASFFGTISKTGELASKLIKDLGEESEGRASLHKITSKAEVWISKKSLHWPWKRNQQEFSEAKSHQSSDLLCPPTKLEIKANEFSHLVVAEENVTSTSSSSSVSVSTNSTRISTKKLDMGSDCLDYEIFWEDLTFKEQIGQVSVMWFCLFSAGSCGTVYHGLWCGSDVAIKVFPQVEYSEDAILSFRQEVSLMKELRHPNTLLFMGAVLSPQCPCIITEFLPRGSLFRLLKKDIRKLDRRRRIHMALDIAQGMNYLHHCNRPIVHRDLKSSNLLVDKNWTVKVADFGLSRIKHETYLTTKTGKGTPQWMAPEVLRYDPSDEKSDVYSFGVILWELATEKIPWEDLNVMQIIGAVGFKNQRLDIPSTVDPRWAAIIESCWQSEPRDRPSFEELLKTLKQLAREYAVRSQAARSGKGDVAQKER